MKNPHCEKPYLELKIVQHKVFKIPSFFELFEEFCICITLFTKYKLWKPFFLDIILFVITQNKSPQCQNLKKILVWRLLVTIGE